MRIKFIFQESYKNVLKSDNGDGCKTLYIYTKNYLIVV